MKKILSCIVMIISFAFLYSLNDINVSAKGIIATKTYTNIFGDALGVINIYDNGEIVIGYKYGLRRVDVLYCKKGHDCDNNSYVMMNVMESSLDNPYKNSDAGLATYTYKIKINSEDEYRVKVEAYFGTSSGYTGIESINGSYTISSLQSVDTKEHYIKVAKSDDDLGDDDLNNLLDKMKMIVNTIVLPIVYILTTMVLVIKGALLGFDIVKSADNPEVRIEKIRALKWLVIGVGVTYLSSSIIGVVTGFFKNLF